MRISDWSSDVCSSDLWSASGSLAYDTRVGGLTLRPMVAVDYFKLKEDGYQETGGGEVLDLTVLSRDSDELAVSGTMTLGLEFGGADEYDGWTRFELEGGRRQIVSRSEEHTSELQSLMRNSYAVFC